jgi:hypothetical protein
VIVGAYMECFDTTQSGGAYVFDGQNGGLLYSLHSPNTQYRGYFGTSVSGAGDVNNDGIPDVVVGAYGEDGGNPAAGRAYVFDGTSGNLISTLASPAPEDGANFGSTVSWVGDLNHDMFDDIIVGARESGAADRSGKAYIFSGIGGDVLHTFESPNPQPWGGFGLSVSGAGYVNNDGQPDVIVGAPFEYAQYENTGRAYVFTPGGVGAGYEPFTKAAEGLRLVGPFPNPTGGNATLWVTAAAPDRPNVELALYDASGRLVAKPLKKSISGEREMAVNWIAGPEVPSGLYWWRLTGDGQEEARATMVLLR